MIILFKIHYLTLTGIISLLHFTYSQIQSFKDPTPPETAPMVSGIHTLSVHVRDTILHDSVYQFFAHKLLLPIYYTPQKYGQTIYAGIYAGNMVLEPCGPYPNIDYATDNLRAIFYGMNFEVYKSLAASEMALIERGIKHQVNKGSIYIRDSILCNENIFSALYKVNDKEKRDSLQKSLAAEEKGKPGIEYIKEIYIGYKDTVNYLKWKEFLYPLDFGDKDICSINDSLQIHFTRGDINEVKGITFKVKSLVEAKHYLLENNLFGSVSDQNIKIDQTQTFGLSIYFTDEK